ncbi:MAG: uL22 family ribosomal protein [archaeon]
MTEEKGKKIEDREKPEIPKEIVKDIKKSGVPDKIAKNVGELDEVKQKPTEIKEQKEIIEKKEEKKSKIDSKKKSTVKKTEVIVKGSDVPISTKQSIAICKFIKGKQIGKAITDLEAVMALKKAVPMKGEIPHRKGKIGSGRFPQKAAKNFLVLLKSLLANSTDIDEPIISEAMANIASRPFGRFGRVKRKRTHITIRITEKKKLKKLKKKKETKTNIRNKSLIKAVSKKEVKKI